MIGARVNGKLVPIEYVIKNGDRIEIITSQNSRGPSRDWLNTVKSTQAKNKINQWFKTEFKEGNIVKGKELIAQYCKMKGIPSGAGSASGISGRCFAEIRIPGLGFCIRQLSDTAVSKRARSSTRCWKQYEKAKKKAVDGRESHGERQRSKRAEDQRSASQRAVLSLKVLMMWPSVFPSAATRCRETRLSVLYTQ